MRSVGSSLTSPTILWTLLTDAVVLLTTFPADEEVYDAIQRLIRAGNGDEAMEEDGEQQQRVLGDQYTMASPELQSPVNGGHQGSSTVFLLSRRLSC